jgi:hypothetical protein
MNHHTPSTVAGAAGKSGRRSLVPWLAAVVWLQVCFVGGLAISSRLGSPQVTGATSAAVTAERLVRWRQQAGDPSRDLRPGIAAPKTTLVPLAGEDPVCLEGVKTVLVFVGDSAG